MAQCQLEKRLVNGLCVLDQAKEIAAPRHGCSVSLLLNMVRAVERESAGLNKFFASARPCAVAASVRWLALQNLGRMEEMHDGEESVQLCTWLAVGLLMSSVKCALFAKAFGDLLLGRVIVKNDTLYVETKAIRDG